MPYRRFTRRRRFMRRRRYVRRPRLTMRRKIGRSSIGKAARKPHFFKRTFEGTPITLDPANPVAGALTFNLGQLPDSTEFTDLFNEYKINLIKIKIMPQFNSVNALTTDQISIGRIYSCVDPRDATAPGSLDDVLQYQNMKHSPIWRGHTRLIKPSVPMIADTPASTLGTFPRYSPWIVTNNATVPHYALKFWVDECPNLEANTDLKVLATFYFACKNVY